MKLLVFAHTPPPVHGQSMMVAMMLEGLRGDPEFEVLHVNPRLSRDHADVGRWRLGKLRSLLAACCNAWRLRFRHGPAVFYYVPAPGKRGALYRDLIVMLLCRPLFPKLVLHWHAAGLGEWLDRRASRLERGLSQWLLGGADLAIVLGEALRSDAAVLAPRQTVVVRNGIADPCSSHSPEARPRDGTFTAVFLGLCCREKGLFAAMAGVEEANRRTRLTPAPFHLVVAGAFPDAATRREFETIAARSDGRIWHVGFVSGEQKRDFLAMADALVFPTTYAHETQGLVVAEALACDLPIIITRWRAVHEGLPDRHVYFVDADQPRQIADALEQARQAGRPAGELRRHFLAHFTRERHLAQLRAALRLL